MSLFQLLTSGMVGIGLAASCGFRVFVPLLFMSIAVHAGQLELSESFHWVGTWPAMIAFGVATFLEIGGYYIPWIDNALDAAASPAAVIAGILATSACVSGTDPMLQWSFAIVAGGGAAALVQTATVAARSVSTATTGGLGNFVVASSELAASALTAILAIVVPIVACLLLLAFATTVLVIVVRRRRKKLALGQAGNSSVPPT